MLYKCLKISYILPFFKRNCTFWSGKIRKTHSPVKTCWVDFWICRGTFGRWTWRAVCWVREAGPSWATGNTAEERKHRPVVRVRSRIISIRTDTVHNNRTSHSVATATGPPGCDIIRRTSVNFLCRAWNSLIFLVTLQRLFLQSSSSDRLTDTQ